MKTKYKNLISIFLTLLIVQIANGQNKDEEKVKVCFEIFKDAVLKGKGEEAIKYVDTETIMWFDEIIKLAKSSDGSLYAKNSFVDNFLINETKVHLEWINKSSADSKSYIVYLINHYSFFILFLKNNAIQDIKLSGNSATAQFVIQEKLSPITIEYNKESGQWKIKLKNLCTFRNTLIIAINDESLFVRSNSISSWFELVKLNSKNPGIILQPILSYLLASINILRIDDIPIEVDFFKNIDFNEKADWLLTRINDESDKIELINDREVLLRYYKDLKILSTRSCNGTTPDCSMYLYKNKKLVNRTFFCSWEDFSYKFGRLNNEFIPAKSKSLEINSVIQYNSILDSLSKLKNVFVLEPNDTLTKLPGSLTFITEFSEDDFDDTKYEEEIEKHFKETFKSGYDKVEANLYMSKPGSPRKLSFRVYVDCDSSFLKIFDQNKLRNHEFFKEMRDYKFEQFNLHINYLQIK